MMDSSEKIIADIKALKTACGDSNIIAVSKHQPAEKISILIDAGHRIFGENHVQEAVSKWENLKTPQIELHMIGRLQSNKVREAVRLFDVIQSVDRASIADAIRRESIKQGRDIRIFVQVNIGGEEQKNGVAIEALGALLEHCNSIGLAVEGLMCVPPIGRVPSLYFALLQKLAAEAGAAEAGSSEAGVRLKTSMGMSGDYEIAAAMGADYLRIGTAIFGERVS